MIERELLIKKLFEGMTKEERLDLAQNLHKGMALTDEEQDVEADNFAWKFRGNRTT